MCLFPSSQTKTTFCRALGNKYQQLIGTSSKLSSLAIVYYGGITRNIPFWALPLTSPIKPFITINILCSSLYATPTTCIPSIIASSLRFFLLCCTAPYQSALGRQSLHEAASHFFPSLTIAKCGHGLHTSLGACALAVCNDMQCYSTIPNPFPSFFLAYFNINILQSSNREMSALEQLLEQYNHLYEHVCSSPPPIAISRVTIRPNKGLQYLLLLCVTVGVQE